MDRLSLEFVDRVAVLKFNHPEVMNAIGQRMLGEFFEALAEIKKPANGARALLLTGEGRGFCAGANLQDEDRGDRRSGAGDGLRTTYHPILLQLRDLEMPMVTAVNGAAAGVGLTLSGWGGRFIEFNHLRKFGRMVRVAELENHGIRVLPIDRNALVPGPSDQVDTRDWLRPRMWGGHPVLPVESQGFGFWRSTSGKRHEHAADHIDSE